MAMVWVLWLAWGLRLLHLGHLPLWGDEGWVAYLGSLDLASLTVETGRDVHPPLYYYILFGWVRAVGPGEFALRYLSVCAGILTVAAVFALGRRLGGARLGLIGALLTTVAPFAIYYSQEARPFVWTMLWCTLALAVLLRVVESASRSGWVGYAALTVCAAFTSYSTALWFALHGLLLVIRREWRRHLVPWLVIQVGALLLAVPWLLIFGLAIQTRLTDQGAFSARTSLSLPLLLARSLSGFAVGITWPPVTAWIMSGAILAAAIGGVIAARSRNLRIATILIGFTLLPILMLYPIHRRFSWFEPRVLAFAAAPLYLFLAVGLEGWRSRGRWAMALNGVLIAAVWGMGLADYWGRFDRYDAKLEDYLPMIAHIQAQAQPGDVVLYNSPWHLGYFQVYYRGPQLGFELFSDDAAGQVLSRSGRVWLVLRDIVRQPGGRRVEDQIEDRISAAAFKVSEAWFGHIRLACYAVPPPGDLSVCPVDAGLGGDSAAPALVRLTHFSLQPVPDDGVLTVQPGQPVYLTLTWQAEAPLTASYAVFTQIIGPYNPRTGGPVWAQHDGVPGNQERPTVGWGGEAIRDPHVLWLDAAAPSGDGYQLVVGLYDPGSSERLAVRLPDGTLTDQVVLARVQVRRAD